MGERGSTMKKWFVWMPVLLCLILTGCGGGDVRQVLYSHTVSEQYTEKEVLKALDTATDYFRRQYDGCTLLELSYDQDTDPMAAKYAREKGAKKAIIVKGSFHVDPDIGPGVWEPDGTYTGYQWILVKNRLGNWKVVDCGYA